MLTKDKAMKIFDEDSDYEENMFNKIAKVSMNDLNNNKSLSEANRKEIIGILKIMTEDTLRHEQMIKDLIDYVNESDKDDF